MFEIDIGMSGMQTSSSTSSSSSYCRTFFFGCRELDFELPCTSWAFLFNLLSESTDDPVNVWLIEVDRLDLVLEDIGGSDDIIFILEISSDPSSSIFPYVLTMRCVAFISSGQMGIGQTISSSSSRKLSLYGISKPFYSRKVHIKEPNDNHPFGFRKNSIRYSHIR